MLKRHWTSENLVFSEFANDEAHLAKSIFDSNSNVKVLDPTFREWPLAEYEKLVNESCRSKLPDDQEAFYLRKISTKKDEVVGYVQLEFHAPSDGTLWLPMLTILPSFKGKGLGSEIVSSVIAVAREYTKIQRLGLNVYVENIPAFRFWYKQGFTQIRAFEPEIELGKEYNCLVLYRELEA
ncbi:GNAT family N-acetyltransferase [Vibrio parahaemolyticus]|uniref:GNAT family N-acetyltransferase n=1 Tax=Vibrio parahaemolyticus TaxID=670 RepID=UPI001A212594|nr:N-acetyltransferase [Vibrio parahaemolyticus]EGQ7920032.1 GNAT family N-acetyltransferase [Vibrio parahaemolyticus]EHH3648786.1 GNAT family N-acetyltransferase [Vibrio parahaemolyticus]EHH3737332.1 GNAT family N-acetyltransferase [Vibrio parahaemolyticus]EHR1110066.1 GNAT family N-acetyltransferase [Vibrio parahaemolyticus]ELI1803841.1 GNAT family N-acetyltransferase [Vibrio parahaemolyticus]